MMMTSMFTWFILISMAHCGVRALKRSYIAAAYEHVAYENFEQNINLIVHGNLLRYQNAASLAAREGADIIVFPEEGLFPPYYDFGDTFSVFEDFPDPKQHYVNPCKQRDLYINRPIISNLSCLAEKSNIVIVAVIGEIENRTGDPDYPSNNIIYFNTNVVFDKNGTMLVKYRKEKYMRRNGENLGNEQQDPTFETDFGTFATFDGFQMIYKKSVEVVSWPQVDGLMFSCKWNEFTPQYSSVTFWQGWAMSNNVTIVVSNLHQPKGSGSVGSGIFHGKYGSLGYTYNPDWQTKLIIAKIPFNQEPNIENSNSYIVNNTELVDLENDGEAVFKDCSSEAIAYGSGQRNSSMTCYDEATYYYTFVKLINSSGNVEACNKGMCCSASYSAEDMLEDYYLAVYNGTFIALDRYRWWCEENCLIVRCDPLFNRECVSFPRTTDTVFHHIEIKANFSTPYIYPSVVSSKSRLVPISEWQHDITEQSAFESSLTFNSDSGRQIINAGFTGRCYERDPPFYEINFE